jgi:hypothetical protein
VQQVFRGNEMALDVARSLQFVLSDDRPARLLLAAKQMFGE